MNIKDEILNNLKEDYIKKQSKKYKSKDRKINKIAVEILQKIIEVIRNDKLDDFYMVEEIVCIFEEYHISCGGTHDF